MAPAEKLHLIGEPHKFRIFINRLVEFGNISKGHKRQRLLKIRQSNLRGLNIQNNHIGNLHEIK